MEISTLLGSADHFDFGESHLISYIALTSCTIAETSKHFLEGIKRALVPGGRFFFYDPLAYNPLIKVYRRLAHSFRSISRLFSGGSLLLDRYWNNKRHATIVVRGLGHADVAAGAVMIVVVIFGVRNSADWM